RYLSLTFATLSRTTPARSFLLMRLKQLLLFKLLLVLVRSIQYGSDYTCQHDGYSAPDATCHCPAYYGAVPGSKGKNTCAQSQCVNSGVPSPYEYDTDTDQRCSCPPGFLGMHCEPVKCVDGDVQSFDLLSRARDVSVIITYNTQWQDQFKNKDKGGPIEETLCDAVFKIPEVTNGSRVHFYMMQADLLVDDPTTCVKEFKQQVDWNCDKVGDADNAPSTCVGKITTDYVMGVLNEMGEDSRLLILSNEGIDDFKNEDGIEDIRKKAISMRIQIHSLVMSQNEPQGNDVYFKDGFQKLRELSESTLGFFINPFDASGGQKQGTNGITDILKAMMPVFFEYVVVDRVMTTSDSCKVSGDFIQFRALAQTEIQYDFWITVISNKAQIPSYTTNFIGNAGKVPIQKMFAGYFNAYTLTTTDLSTISYKPTSVQKSGKCVPTTVLVLARSGHLARFAITNSEDLDATSPYAISGDTNLLVGHFTKHYHEENLEKLNLEFTSSDPLKPTPFDISKLDAIPIQRQCQYNAMFGAISCNDGDDTFIRVRDMDTGAAVTVQNLYCSPKETTQDSSSKLLSLLEAAPVSPADAADVCTPKEIIAKKDGRALIIAAHATWTIYQLFNGNKNSAIKYLNDLDDTEIYDQYILNIYNADQATDATVVDNYPDFKDNLMSTWHSYVNNTIPTPLPMKTYFFDEECAGTVSAVFPLEDIIISPLTKARPNSDIIFIFDHKIDIEDSDLRDILKEAYNRRLKLIVLLLGCDADDFSDSKELKKWQSIASQTGGFAVYFRHPSDLNEFLESYVGWVQGQTAGAIDNKDDFLMNSISSTPFQVKQGGNYTILVNCVPSDGIIMTLGNGDTLENPTVLGNSLTKFDYTAQEDGTLNVTVTPQLYFYYVSIRVLDLNDDYATIGFAKSKDEPCLEQAYPDFNPHEAQYPLTVASAEDTVEMTLFDSTGAAFRNGPAAGKNGNFELNYNWRCNDNTHTFYISADVTTSEGSFTRLFTTQCIGVSDGKVCINGEHPSPDNKDECVCTHDYTGEFCEIPVCQNGGSVTSSLECDCLPDYSGAFCEMYLGCTGETDPQWAPDFKTIASTIIFVVERSADVVKKLKSVENEALDNVRAAQYIVVQYGNSSEADVIISTTDKAALLTTLKKIEAIKLYGVDGVDDTADVSSTTTPDIYFDAVPAIAAALQAQVTGSAQIFWFAENDYAYDFADELFDSISHLRVSITALFSSRITDTPIHPVQVAGGSVFYYPHGDDTDNNYGKFFTNYIAELLQFQPSFEFRPNLLLSSNKCKESYKVNIDQSTIKLFVAANEGEIKISGDKYVAHDIPGGRVFTFDRVKKNVYAGAGEVTVTITRPTDIEYCSTTITAFSQIQIGYGFVKHDDDIYVMPTTKKGEHLLVTYWTSESVTDTPTPTAIVTPITLDEGFGNSTEVYATVRGKCSYSLSVPVDCAEGVNAIGVTVSDWVIPTGGGTAYKVDKFISVLCPEGECVHGNTTDDGCECDPFWGGDYCTEALCKNGEIVGDICACYTGYTGDDCNEIVPPADRDGVSYLFIQDVCGSDETLKDTAQGVLVEYYKLFKSTDKFYLGTNNADNSETVLVATLADLTNAMTENRKAAQCTASIGATLDSYYLKLRKPSGTSSAMLNAASDPSVGKAKVSHVTTVPVNSNTGSYFNDLGWDYILGMEFIGITYKNELFPNPTSFDIFKGDFTQTYDPEIALLELVDAMGSDTNPVTYSPANIDRCIQNLQAAFVFHTDISTVPNMADFRNKASSVIKSVTNYFNIPDVKVIDMDDDTCEFNTDQQANKTLFYGSIYADAAGIGVPTFCSSNMNSYPDTIKTANYKQASQVTLQSVVDSYTKWYNTDMKMKCHCFDYANPDTTSIILWTPLSPTSLDKGAVSFDGFKPGNFKHIVMPFGFTYKDSALWRGLVPDESNWIGESKSRDAAKDDYAVEQIIQDIWTITCRLAGRIEDSSTAEPFNPYNIKDKNKAGETIRDDDLPTDDPNRTTPL
ncbi:hypothetical protein PENTCL1PPCAC_29349, partial [Pristionchus entomophagus]